MLRPARRVCSILAFLLAAGGVAVAQPRPEDLTRAKAHFKQGKAYQDIAAYDKAIAEYEEAYRLSSLPELVFNIGQCQRLAGRLPEALASFRRYLELAPDGKGADEARAAVARLAVEIEEQEAARQRELAAAATGPAEKDGGAPPPKPAPPPPPPRPGRGLRLAGLAAGGVGVLALGAGIYYGLDAQAKSDALSTATGSWTQAQIDDVAAGEAAERNMIISVAVGAVGLGVGAYLYHLGGLGAESPTVTPVVGPAGAGLVLQGVF